MKEGVKRDLERQQRKQENIYRLDEQKRLQEKLEQRDHTQH